MVATFDVKARLVMRAWVSCVSTGRLPKKYAGFAGIATSGRGAKADVLYRGIQSPSCVELMSCGTLPCMKTLVILLLLSVPAFATSRGTSHGTYRRGGSSHRGGHYTSATGSHHYKKRPK